MNNVANINELIYRKNKSMFNSVHDTCEFMKFTPYIHEIKIIKSIKQKTKITISYSPLPFTFMCEFFFKCEKTSTRKSTFIGVYTFINKCSFMLKSTFISEYTLMLQFTFMRKFTFKNENSFMLESTFIRKLIYF